MTVITQTLARAGFYLGESAPLNIINEEIIVASGAGVLVPGTVISRITDGGTQTVAAATADATNTGNGTVGSLTGDAGAELGDWRLVCIEPAANGGTFAVFNPSGDEVGRAVVASAFNGTVGLNFTIADGATDFVAGDAFTISVSYSAGAKADRYVLHDPALTNGAEDPTNVAILFDGVDATSADVTCVATVRGPATIFGTCLTYKSGMSDANKLAAKNALRDKGLAVLPQHAGA